MFSKDVFIPKKSNSPQTPINHNDYSGGNLTSCVVFGKNSIPEALQAKELILGFYWAMHPRN